MLTRHDWAMLSLIGLSAFASGSLTCLAFRGVTDSLYQGVHATTVEELGVELDSEGYFFFAPLKPLPKRQLVIGEGRYFSVPPIRLKKGEGALLDYDRRVRIPSLFRRSAPSRFESGEKPIYLFVPTGETFPLTVRPHSRIPG